MYPAHLLRLSLGARAGVEKIHRVRRILRTGNALRDGIRQDGD
jgi:hypothetical protein